MQLPVSEQRWPPHNPDNTQTWAHATADSSLGRQWWLWNIQCTLAYCSKHRAASVCLLASRSFSENIRHTTWLTDIYNLSRKHAYMRSPPARSRASSASCSGGNGMCVATARAFLQLVQLTKACRAWAFSPHRHSNSPACSACCCSTRCSA